MIAFNPADLDRFLADPDYQKADPVRMSALIEAVLKPVRGMDV